MNFSHALRRCLSADIPLPVTAQYTVFGEQPYLVKSSVGKKIVMTNRSLIRQKLGGSHVEDDAMKGSSWGGNAGLPGKIFRKGHRPLLSVAEKLIGCQIK